jgi:hypothetical protein
VRGRSFPAVARPLTPQESGEAMARYARRRPRTARRLMKVCGLAVDGTEEDYAAVGRDYLPFVLLTATGEPFGPAD